MPEDTIIVIDKIENAVDNEGKAYFKVTDKAGVTRNFKEGHSKLLTNKGHLLKEGVALKLYFQDFKRKDGVVFPFVSDFEEVKNIFEREATENVQRQVKVDTNAIKVRSMSVSYSHDLVVAKIIQLKEMFDVADKFVDYILNVKKEIKDEKIESPMETLPNEEEGALAIDRQAIYDNLLLLSRSDDKIWKKEPVMRTLTAIGGTGETAREMLFSLLEKEAVKFGEQVAKALKKRGAE